MAIKIEHRLGVPASAEVVWAAIADISAWPTWNPLYVKAVGVLRIGSVVELEAVLPGQKPRAIRALIVDWVPNEQILWKASLLGGLVRTVRYIEIERLSADGCIFANGEIFSGVLGPTVARRLRRPLRQGFAAMGEAVKARVLSAAGLATETEAPG